MSTTLYFAPGACSMASHIVLNEVGKPFELKQVMLAKGEQYSPEYQKINIKSKVPVLVADGRTITENVAILTYLGRSNPQLWVSGPDQEIGAMELLAWGTSGLHPLFRAQFRPSALCDVPGTEDNVRKLGAEQIKQALARTDKMIAGKEWALDRYSVVDPYLFVFFRWATRYKIDTAGAPNYAAHYERMLQRPTVQKMLETEEKVQVPAH